MKTRTTKMITNKMTMFKIVDKGNESEEITDKQCWAAASLGLRSAHERISHAKRENNSHDSDSWVSDNGLKERRGAWRVRREPRPQGGEGTSKLILFFLVLSFLFSLFSQFFFSRSPFSSFFSFFLSLPLRRSPRELKRALRGTLRVRDFKRTFVPLLSGRLFSSYSKTSLSFACAWWLGKIKERRDEKA